MLITHTPSTSGSRLSILTNDRLHRLVQTLDVGALT